MANCCIELQDLFFERAGQPLAFQHTITAADVTTVYDRHPLPLTSTSKKIRVLELQPSPSRNAPLVGALKILDMADPNHPPFSALSYVWSQPASPTVGTLGQIRRGSWKLDLSPNCCSALQHLRSETEPLNIWVDSICINQNADSKAEKEFQIPLMGALYSTAALTYVWVGEESPESSRVMDALARGAKASLLPLNPRQQPRPPSLTQKTLFTLQHLPPYSYLTSFTQVRHRILLRREWKKQGGRDEQDRFRDLDEFYSRPWFSRGWTFQECILASEIILVCGNKRLSWDAFIRGSASVFQFETTSYRGSSLLRRLFDDAFPPHDREDFNAMTIADFQDLDPASDPALPSQLFTKVETIFQLWVTIPRRSASGIEISHRTCQDAFYKIHRRLTGQSPGGSMFIGVIKSLPLTVPILFESIQAILVNGLITNDLAYFITVGPIFILLAACVVALVIVADRRTTFAEADQLGNNLESDKVTDQMIEFLRGRQVSEDKDMAFSLRGILPTFGIYGPGPDYSLPLGEVYRQLCCDLLRWNPGFIILLMDAETPRDIHTALGFEAQSIPCPSWVPDWSGPLKNEHGQALFPKKMPAKSVDWYFSAHLRAVTLLHAAPTSSQIRRLTTARPWHELQFWLKTRTDEARRRLTSAIPYAIISPDGTQLVVHGEILAKVVYVTHTPGNVDLNSLSGADTPAAVRLLKPSLILMSKWLLKAAHTAKLSRRALSTDTVYLTLSRKYWSNVRIEELRQEHVEVFGTFFTTGPCFLDVVLACFAELHSLLIGLDISNDSSVLGVVEALMRGQPADLGRSVPALSI